MCNETGKAAVIDPAWNGELIARTIADSGWELSAIWLTHAHFDHVGGLAEMLTDGQSLDLGELRLTVLYTPGHAPGHICLYLPDHDVLFDGDVLFQQSIGRTDLPGGDSGLLISSIRERLLTLPDKTIVLSGHGSSTTIGEERQNNPFLTGLNN